MLRLSANLSMLFGELDFLDRFDAARRAGFAAVEVQYPYDLAVSDIRLALEDAGLPLVLVNAPRGALPADRGLACLADRTEEFRLGIDMMLDYSGSLGNRLAHVLSGMTDPNGDREAAVATWRENMTWAAERAASAGISLVVEALNQVDTPGYFLGSPEDALGLIEKLDHPNVGILFDTYHCGKSAVDLQTAFSRLLPKIRHIQIADVPSRSEPGTGHLDWHGFFSIVKKSGYKGYLGAEYRPVGDTLAGLGWARPYLGKS